MPDRRVLVDRRQILRFAGSHFRTVEDGAHDERRKEDHYDGGDNSADKSAYFTW